MLRRQLLALAAAPLLLSCSFDEPNDYEYHAPRLSHDKRANVYLLADYDGSKVPVLFVHGAGATPRAWRYFIAHLDAARYQPWVYQYPTGVPIDVSAQWLSDELAALRSRYGFRQVVVVGHSMGGLVARKFIALNVAETGVRYTLVTFATPWGGVPFAGVGAAALGRYAVPSWKDLAPESPFLLGLQAESLPAVAHYLFFAYLERGDSLDTDGIISVSSQLEAHIQERAVATYGFRATHGAVIEDPVVLERFTAVLRDISDSGARPQILAAGPR